eukprot:jgi/Psemu1/29482/gm1.29482_g
MVMKLKLKDDNPCWFKLSRESPPIQVKAISLVDPNFLSLEVEPSLEIKVDPNAPPPAAMAIHWVWD